MSFDPAEDRVWKGEKKQAFEKERDIQSAKGLDLWLEQKNRPPHAMSMQTVTGEGENKTKGREPANDKCEEVRQKQRRPQPCTKF
jgi:hypothetical protein